MEDNYKNAFCEVLYILERMDNEYLNRIPKKLLELFRNNCSRTYDIKLLDNISLEKQELLKETKIILAFLCRKYLCDDETKKKLEEKFKKEIML